jgi:hypothetical protein
MEPREKHCILMPRPSPLLRSFVKKITEKSFDKGLRWGIVSGVFVSHLYYTDKLNKLEDKYYAMKRNLH